METVLRTYLVLYSPKYYLIKISKIYSYINFFGYVLGFLISCFLLLIPDFGRQVEILVYNKKNCTDLIISPPVNIFIWVDLYLVKSKLKSSKKAFII